MTIRWIAIFLLLAGMTGARAVPVQASASTAVNPANSPDKPTVYVGGQVQKPGHYPWFHGMTVFDVINATADSANPNGHLIWISRPDGTRIHFSANTFPYGLARPPPVSPGNCVEVQA